MEQNGFRDRNHRYSYLVACAVAQRIIAHPAEVAQGRRHLESFVASEPRFRDGYALWKALLQQPSDVIAARLTERSARGDLTRETAPNFGPLPAPVRTALLRRARAPLGRAPDGTAPETDGGPMPAKPKRLRKREIAHLLRAAAGVEGRQSFVMIGTGAVIARLKTVPLDRRATREIDIYVADADAADTLADRLACRACGGEGLRRGVEGSVLTFCSTGCDARHTPNESQAGDRWQRR